MKLNKLILVSLFLLAILCLGAVSAQENVTSETDGGQNQDVLIPVQEVSEDTTNEIQITSNDDDEILTASDEEIVGEITADNVTVDASNVFEGQNATISVTVPEATGTVTITVGDDIYTPEFISGVATQTISKYSIGLNNVTIQYNDIIKQTSFKVLDGVVTNDTFTDYFDGDGKILDAVPEGAILDFQGVFEISDNIKAIYINKPVTITSSTKDAVIMFNSVNGDSGKDTIANRFIVDSVSSFEMDNILFNRTQLAIFDSSNVVLDNINVISKDYCMVTRVTGIGITRFSNVENISIRNSKFTVKDIGGSIIELSNVKNFIFDNNEFNVYSNSTDSRLRQINGIYMTAFIDTNANITNNKFNGEKISTLIRLPVKNVLLENNTVSFSDAMNYGSMTFGIRNQDTYITVKNNILAAITFMVKSNPILSNNTIKNSFLFAGAHLTMYNNTIGSHTNPASEIQLASTNFYNNTAYGKITIGADSIIDNSMLEGSIMVSNVNNVTIQYSNFVGSKVISSGVPYHIRILSSYGLKLYNNTIEGIISVYSPGSVDMQDNNITGNITVSSKDSVIKNNFISSSSDYAIIIEEGNAYINNEISNNVIYSNSFSGDNAVSFSEDYINTIKDNTPIQLDLIVNANNVEYDEIVEISISINAAGNVTIDVDGKKYSAELVNGIAKYNLTNYVLGVNNVTVLFEDTVNDYYGINKTTFNVNKVSTCPIALSYENATEGKFAVVNVLLPDDANGTIAFEVTNGIYTVYITQDANGANNTITLPGLLEGNYTMSATFSSVKYVTNSTSATISFVHVPVYKLSAKAISMDYYDGTKYKVLVTKDGKAVGAGEIVKITFNGKTTSVKTDKNGYATLALNAAPKTYTIKAVYQGKTISTKVVIKNVLKANNLAKKKAATIKYTATLKNSKGKAIAGKVVKFKIKGKTYSVKTNSKGVATVALKNLAVGKYYIVSSYGACTVKKLITIKK